MLSEKDQPRQAFLFHRAYPALGKRVQVRTACRQLQGLDLAGFDHLAKHRTELAVAIMQQVATVCQKAPILHRYVSCLLLHPLLVRIRRDPGQAHAPRLQLDEEKHVVRDQTFATTPPNPCPSLSKKLGIFMQSPCFFPRAEDIWGLES